MYPTWLTLVATSLVISGCTINVIVPSPTAVPTQPPTATAPAVPTATATAVPTPSAVPPTAVPTPLTAKAVDDMVKLEAMRLSLRYVWDWESGLPEIDWTCGIVRAPNSTTIESMASCYGVDDSLIALVSNIYYVGGPAEIIMAIALTVAPNRVMFAHCLLTAPDYEPVKPCVTEHDDPAEARAFVQKQIDEWIEASEGVGVN